jgi:serine/threonine-protein kinase HipA
VNPLASAQGKGERLSEILAWDGTESLFAELVDKYIYRTGISGVQPKLLG